MGGSTYEWFVHPSVLKSILPRSFVIISLCEQGCGSDKVHSNHPDSKISQDDGVKG